MPAGTCDVCGCTEERACVNGCHWIWEDRRHCSQCVAWVLLRLPNTYEGILPYNLWPVRTLEAIPTGGPLGSVWPLDVRRVDREALERIGHVAAPALGYTVDEFLEEVGGGREPFVIRHRNVAQMAVARDLEQAARMVEAFARTGTVPGGSTVMLDREGGLPRG